MGGIESGQSETQMGAKDDRRRAALTNLFTLGLAKGNYHWSTFLLRYPPVSLSFVRQCTALRKDFSVNEGDGQSPDTASEANQECET